MSKRSPILNNNDDDEPLMIDTLKFPHLNRIDPTKITTGSLNATRITAKTLPTGLFQPIPSTFDADEEVEDTSALKKTIDKLRPPRKRKKR